MYIPNEISKKVQKVGSLSQAKLIDGGKLLSYKAKVYKVLAVTAAGVQVEDFVDNDGLVPVSVYYNWDMIV